MTNPSDWFNLALILYRKCFETDVWFSKDVCERVHVCMSVCSCYTFGLLELIILSLDMQAQGEVGTSGVKEWFN